MEMMNYEEFKDAVGQNLRQYLPESEKESDILIQTVEKNNKVKLDSLCVKRETDTISPVIYLGGYYENYISGDYFEEVLQNMADAIMSAKEESLNFVMDFLTDYSHVKDSLILSTCNYEKNKELLKEIPHEVNGDFAITVKYQCLGGTGTVHIKDSLLEHLGVSKEQLFADAYDNAPQYAPYKFQSMTDILREMMPDFEPEYEIEPSMYVLTNEQKLCGASAMFYPGVLQKISRELQSDLHIIPSSIHEVIIVTGDEMDSYRLRSMIEEVNATEVAPEEILGDRPYTYDAIEKKIVPMVQYEKHMYAIKEGITRSGFQPTQRLMAGMRKLEKVTGLRPDLKDMYTLAKSVTKESDPKLKEALNEIARECKAQQLMRPGMEPGM